MSTATWLLYGAYGYTGTLIAEEAVRRGHRPTLAGRDPARLRPLAERLGLPHVAVGLDDAATLAAAVRGHRAVLHAAGPFVRTGAPMRAACLAEGASYLDITGELPAFVEAFAQDAAARSAGVALVPGVGFDVVPTDCLARYVAERVAGADRLEIGLCTLGGSMSAGTAESMLGLLPQGGRVRRAGQLRRRPLGRGARKLRFFSHRENWALPAPLGDLETAFHTTRIPDITCYYAVPGRVARAMELAWPLGLAAGPLARRALQLGPVEARLRQLIQSRVQGPDADARQRGRAVAWAAATAPSGERAEAWLETPEGYAFTAVSAVLAVERLLERSPRGALSPALAFGADFALEVPGTRRLDRPADP